MKDKLSIIIPAYNEEPRIVNTLNETVKVMSSIGIDYEIIVVDDGSKDNTFGRIEELSKKNKNILAIKNKKNKGKGFAIISGFSHTTGDLVTFLDADLDLHPIQIKLFLDYMKLYGVDVVIGSKRHPDSKLNYPWLRKFLSWGYYVLNRILFKLPVKDTQAGLKLYKKKVLSDVLPRIVVKGYAFDLEILVNAHRLGYKIIEAPITLNFQKSFGRIGLRTIYKIAWDTAAIFYRTHILKYYNK